MSDPHVDPEHQVLRNRLGLTDRHELGRVEAEWSFYRELELYLVRPANGSYDFDHLRAIHRHLFGDVYPWAGELRTVDLSKGLGVTVFAPARSLHQWGREIFGRLAAQNWLRGLDRQHFVASAGSLLADINLMHAFREGNGRSQRAFLNCLANDLGWSLAWAQVTEEENIRVSKAAVENEAALVALLDRICTPLTGELEQLALQRQHHEQRPGLGLEL